MTRDSSEAVSFFICLIGNIHYKSSLSEKDNKNLYYLKPRLIFLWPSWPDKIFFVSHHFKVRSWGLIKDTTAGFMSIV